MRFRWRPPPAGGITDHGDERVFADRMIEATQQGRSSAGRLRELIALRLHILLIVASLTVPAAYFAVVAVKNRADVEREARDAVLRTSAVLREHASKVFETQELALAWVTEHIRDRTPEQIAAPETSSFLVRLLAPLEQAVSLWVTDRDGVVRAGSQAWDPRQTLNEREFFRVHREGEMGAHVSAVFRGRATALRSFALSRPRIAAEGRFDGTVHISLSPEYFERFFAEAVAPLGHSAVLMREDGEILARSPPLRDAERQPSDSPLMKAIAAHADHGFFRGFSSLDGRERIYAYHRISPYPVYIVFGADVADVVQRWYDNLWLFGSAGAITAALLLLASSLALRRARAERKANARLHGALDELHRQTAAREAAESRVRQGQRMEALGQLAGGIAHDVNNVLQAASSGARLIQRRPAEAEQVRRLAGMVLEATERGASVARRLLAFARQGELRAADVDAAAMLTDLHEVLGHTLGAGVEVRTAIAVSLPPLRADKGQLETVLLNLATNARDAMAETSGGVLTIGAALEQVEGCAAQRVGLAPGAYLRLTVADTGSGMDAATLARATEPFFSTKPQGRGTGLGLAMAKGFAEQSGGGMAIESEPGLGTTVTLWLPRSSEAEMARIPAPPEPDAIEADGAAPRVLLVDDVALVRETLAAELVARGWRVTPMADGAGALRLIDAGEGEFDLMLADLAMPGMNGLELIREVRRRRPGLPAMLVTGLVGDGAAAQAALAEAVRDGPFALLRKPLEPRELAARAATLLHIAEREAAD